MRIPTITGIIKRRVLVNFRADPRNVQSLLPGGFWPKLHEGWAITGICLIRLEQIRPVGVPRFLGVTSENAAHRIAVCWNNQQGEIEEGVFIPRRDTSSRFNQLAGGRLFPGEHHRAIFSVKDADGRIELQIEGANEALKIRLRAADAKFLPQDSCFKTLADASAFFENGSVGYSATRSGKHLDGLALVTQGWKVQPLAVSEVYSSFFADYRWFPPGSIEFDHALVMRDVQHEWRQVADWNLKSPSGVPLARDPVASH